MPYEILRLKNHLGLNSGAFLERYTQSHAGPTTGLPIVTLKPGPGDDHPCPFVAPKGCRVYNSRPASCRIYPLMRGLQKDPRDGVIKIHYALLKEPHCRGFEQPETQTVEQWLQSQELEVYNTMNDRMVNILDLKNRYHPGPLDLRGGAQFRLALYDLDNFRDQVFNKGVLDRFPVDSDKLENAQRDETVLLEIGFDWLAGTLFSTP
jgi:Fe-S-cluster containining protein